MILKTRHFICFALLMAITVASLSPANAAERSAASQAKERELIAVLRSDAPPQDKAIPCKQLAIYGTADAVPALAPLLADKELASWALIALEAIPGPVADKALRDAMGKLQGRLLIGVINSIAVRRDTQGVKGLIEKLDASDTQVASAAAIALGRIGGQQATQALVHSLADAPAGIRSDVAEGCILCAEHFLAQGDSAKAIKLYDTIRQADVPTQRILEAVRGAVLARGSQGIPLLIEQLESKDRARLGIGLRTARELPGSNVTEALAAELDRLPTNRQPLLLLALADRKDAVVLPTVLKAAQNGAKPVRITAIGLLIHLGSISCVPMLLDAALEGDAELTAAAQETLERLPGKDVDTALLGRLGQAKGKQRQLLIELVAERRVDGALPAIMQSVTDTDAGIRGAALQAVTILGEADQASTLVKLLQEARGAKARAEVTRALLAVSGRGGTTCLPDLLPLMKNADSDLRMIGLRTMAIVGGPDALAAVKTALKDKKEAVQDEAVRTLSTWPNNWPEDAEAAKILLTLAKSGEKTSQKVLGLRGYLQYVRGSKKIRGKEKVTRIHELLGLIKRAEEKRLAIAVLGSVPSSEALELLMTLAKDRAVTEEAYSAIVNLTRRDSQGLSKEARRKALQTVVEKSKNNGTKKRASDALRGLR